ALAKRKRTAGAAVVAVVAKWKVGDLVLTKMKGFQAWPAMFDDHEVIVILLCSKIMVGCNGRGAAGGGTGGILRHGLAPDGVRVPPRRPSRGSSPTSLTSPNPAEMLTHADERERLRGAEVVKNEGWERLYGRLMPSLVGTAASQVGSFASFVPHFVKNRAEARALERSRRGLGDGSVGMLQSLTVAALSGCVNALLTNPIWVVVTRMQTHKKANKQQILQGLTCALDEPLEAATAENAPYKTDNEERVSDHCEERGEHLEEEFEVEVEGEPVPPSETSSTEAVTEGPPEGVPFGFPANCNIL
ncbi:hypothetical protein ACJX0J_037457, partial [Zea mays]